MDSEKVTLGQRKNQLSRRLRLARKQHTGDGDGSGDSQSGAGDIHFRNSTIDVNGRLSHTNSESISWKHLQQQPRTCTKLPSSIGARALQMKRDHAELADLSDEEDKAEKDLQQEEANKQPRMAKFHPDYAPLFVPPAGAREQSQSKDAASVLGMSASPSLARGAPSNGSPLSTTMFSQQVANPFSVQPQGQPRASAVAISSLTHSAQSVGLTLEQLAVTLASNPSGLVKVLTDTYSADALAKKMEVAKRLFEAECKSLYAKSMLMAGFEPSDCQPNARAYQDFADRVWQGEKERLEVLFGKHNSDELGVDFSKSTCQSSVVSMKSQATTGHHEHHHETDHNHKHNEGGCDSRHLHRIDGQCGHKAIIHKPKDGIAHIDFVVGNKVECYHGIDPLGASVDAAWPSRYKCKEAGDHTSCGYDNCKELPDVNVPKIIELSEINLQDPEWNYDVNGSIDGSIAGLFRLGRSDELTTVGREEIL